MEFKDLPEEIRIFSTSKEVTDSIIEIANIYKISDKVSEIAKIIGKICLKEIEISKLQENLRNKLEIQDETTLKNITIDIAEKILLPMKHYLQGVEDLIKSLGGEVAETKKPITPVSMEDFKAVPATPVQESVSSKMNVMEDPQEIPAAAETTPPIIQEDIRRLIQKNPQIGSQEIGTEDIITGEDRAKIRPTISNFLSDYDYFLGAGWHSNLDRIKYLGQNENARRLSDKEKDVLARILESYDDEKSLPFSLTPAGLLYIEEYREQAAPETPLKKPALLMEALPPPPPPPPPPIPIPQPKPTRQFPPVPKENIINLKEKQNGTIPAPPIH